MAWAGPAIGIAGSIFGGLFGAHASNNAANQYIQYLQQAQQELQNTETQGEQLYSPYTQAGAGATGTLQSLLASPGQGLLTPWKQTFTAPTAAQAAATPGYQFQLQQGENAMQNSAAAQGGLLTGRTLANLNNYAQDVASTNYQNTFNNSVTQYQSAYNTFLNNQNSTYNQLLGLSQEGLGATQGETSFMGNMGGDIASVLAEQGAVRAQGTLGAANAYESILPGISNQLSPLGMMRLSSLGGGGGSTGGGAPAGGFEGGEW